MPAQYLLPCSCGQKVVVDIRSAGQTVRCACGAAVETPTLRGLTKLERTADSAPAPRSTWNPAKGIAFLGIVLALGGLMGAGCLYAYENHLLRSLPGFNVDLEANQREVDKMPLGDTYNLWQELQRGYTVPETMGLRMSRESIERLQQGVNFSLIFAAIGAVVMVGGVVYDRSK